jgi:hypothetical protein
LDDTQFTALLQRPESETLDFKAQLYNFEEEEGRLSLVKDVLCMSNTPRTETSHIVFGVKKTPDGSCELLGLSKHPDDADLQSRFTGIVHPIPRFTYSAFTYRGKSFGIISIPPTRVGPSAPLVDGKRVLLQHQLYFRRGSKNDIAAPADAARIYAWFGSQGQLGTPAYTEKGSQEWDSLIQQLQRFGPDHKYVLVADASLRERASNLTPLGLVPWAAVLDFDPESDSDGLLASCRTALETRSSIHLVTDANRPIAAPIGNTTYWFFARGLAGREDTLSLGSWRTWRQSRGAALSEFVQRIAAACAPQPVVCLAVWNDSERVRFLETALGQVLDSFAASGQIVVLTDDVVGLQIVSSDVGASLYSIPLPQLLSGIASVMDKPSTGELQLPSSSGAPVTLDEASARWIEEELELVELRMGQFAPDGRDVGIDFLRGNEIAWYELGLHYDVDRDLAPKLRRQLQTELSRRRIGRINVYHPPGAGGTTLGRRMLWDFHNDYPCGVLLKSQPRETAERLARLTAMTTAPFLLLVDGATIAERQIDELYDILKSRQMAVVILQILRRFSPQTEGPRAYPLESALSDREAQDLAHVLGRARPSRRQELESLAKVLSCPGFGGDSGAWIHAASAASC